MKKITILTLITGFITAGSVFAGDHHRGHKGRFHATPEQKQAFRECVESTKVKKPNFKKGERPSKEDVSKMKKCLEDKGVKIPRHVEDKVNAYVKQK